MSNIFRELQLIAESSTINTIENSRNKLNEIVKFFKSREDYVENQIWFSKLRDLEYSTLDKADGFFIDDTVSIVEIPKDLRHDSLGICRGNDLLYSGRYVYPVKDPMGNTMGWCGYDKFESIKYLDSTNYGYKPKTMYYGMENIHDYYNSSENVFIVEGIVCCNWLRQEGFNSLASLGSYLSPYMIEIAKRFGHRAIFVTDSDESGNKYKSQVKRSIPMARCVQSKVAKDVDDTRKIVKDLRSDLLGFKSKFYRSKYFI